MPARRSALAMAAALGLPPLAWFLFQQGLAFALRLDCVASGPPYGPLAGALALLGCAAAAGIALPAALHEPASETRGLLARLALGLAAACALAIAIQIAATTIEPPCWR